ncbi:MAG: helicase-associated domain-containing protein [Treponema sp.]|jgi:hypothetical protein|nr:helicase-associated domain-containing protein [Treponema sp.]
MKRPLFRPLDFWKSALTILPDSSFFELLRSVFGNIKTPFNKQRLLADLAAFLSKEEIQKTISAYIDERDARVIAAVAVLGEPAPGEMESFFAGELSYAALHDILLNLEERFILYRFREEGISRLALNPALEPVLAPVAGDVSPLFPSVPAAAPPPPPVLDDRLLGGVLSFIAGDSLFFKSGGEIRKKSLDAGALVFPGLDLELVAGGFLFLGLIRAEGPDERRISAFAGLSRRERVEYAAAGAYWFRAGGGSFAASHLFRGPVRPLAAFIHRFMNLVRPDRWYPPDTLKRYGNVLEREENPRIRPTGGEERISLGALFDIMERFGLLVSPKPSRRGRNAKAPPRYWSAGSLYAPPEGEGAGGSPVLAMDSPFSSILYPGIGFTDVWALAAFLTVREAGAAVRFELTRESAVRGFDRGLDAAGMIALLKRLSGNRISENLIWSLGDWEKRYGEVKLRRGIVLTLSEDRRYLAEAEPVAALIGETLAPGVYLLRGSEAAGAEEALRKAGVDIIARRAADTPGDRAGGLHPGGSPAGSETPGPFPALEKPAPGPGKKTPAPAEGRKTARERTALEEKPAAAGPAVSSPPPYHAAGGETLKKRFHAALAKMSLGKEERDELSARINRRLILGEPQLEGASFRYEKLEARLLDYVGKAAVAKQAISLKSPVEVTWPHPRQGMIQIIGIPSVLEKAGGESILVLTPLSPETAKRDGTGDPVSAAGEPIRIPLGKISLLRRIKKSIFGE